MPVKHQLKVRLLVIIMIIVVSGGYLVSGKYFNRQTAVVKPPSNVAVCTPVSKR